MTIKATAIDDVIISVVTALNAANLGYAVFDGPPTKRNRRGTDTKYVCIGIEDVPQEGEELNAATMDQEWYGLGQKARLEELHIECLAIGKAISAASARSLALAIVQDVANNLSATPSNETYGALVSNVSSARVKPSAGGTVVTVQFTISANARLI